MNNKQTLLQSPQIDAVRDKTLSFGCELKSKNGNDTIRYISEVKKGGYEQRPTNEFFVDVVGDGICPQSFDEDSLLKYYEILGHPLTHADLLRALDKQAEGDEGKNVKEV